MIFLTLPYPPSMNTYWRFTNRGVYLSKKGREYKEIVSAANQAIEPFKDERLLVTIFVSQPDKRKRDLDNILKAILDSLNGIAYEDDSQIDELRVIRCAIDKENPRVDIRIDEIKQHVKE